MSPVVPVTDTDKESITVSSTNTVDPTTTTEDEDTVAGLPFELNIRPSVVPPVRSPAGRTRIPSPFDDILPGLKGKGWQDQPHDGKVVPYEVGEDGTPKFNKTTSIADSNAKAIHAQLQKAVKFLNSEEGGEHNLGLDVYITPELVQFNIRDKQNRKTKVVAPDGEELSEDDDLEFDDDDDTNGEE